MTDNTALSSEQNPGASEIPSDGGQSAESLSTFNYEAAKREIEALESEIQNPETDIDTLGEKVARLVSLADQCLAKLTVIEQEVAQHTSAKPEEY